ncbi:MAG: ABC transporter permease, partial [Chloroflexi bacterium]|nr:ABC transporter permease [Chloroflexota bacterium]
GVGGGFLLILIMFVFALCLTSLGLLIATKIKSMEAFQVVMQMMLFPLMFLSPTMMPASTLPTWLGVIVRLNPVSYGVDAMRQTALGSGSPEAMIGRLTINGYRLPVGVEMAVVAVIAVVIGILTIKSFRTQE